MPDAEKNPVLVTTKYICNLYCIDRYERKKNFCKYIRVYIGVNELLKLRVLQTAYVRYGSNSWERDGAVEAICSL
jgi:hypothetical protein